MLHIDLPTRSDIVRLSEVRAHPCVSLYLATTPVTADAQIDRIEIGNLLKEAVRQLTDAGSDSRTVEAIRAAVHEIAEDDGFWAHQAHGLAVLVTPDSVQTWRLPNRVTNAVHVSDRFHIKPLLRSATFPQTAWVLALGMGHVRLVEVSPDLPPHTVAVPNLPRDMADALGRRNALAKKGPMAPASATSEHAQFTRYARAVDEALRPFLAGHERPLIVAAADPLASIFRAVSSYPHTAEAAIAGSADHTADHVLAADARGVLDGIYAADLAALADLYGQRGNEGRATADIAQAARAATFGAIDTLIVDMDAVIPGTVADSDGAVTFAETDDAVSYGIVDEITARALRAGARIVAARQPDVPGGGALAAILRYAM